MPRKRWWAGKDGAALALNQLPGLMRVRADRTQNKDAQQAQTVPGAPKELGSPGGATAVLSDTGATHRSLTLGGAMGTAVSPLTWNNRSPLCFSAPSASSLVGTGKTQWQERSCTDGAHCLSGEPFRCCVSVSEVIWDLPAFAAWDKSLVRFLYPAPHLP